LTRHKTNVYTQYRPDGTPFSETICRFGAGAQDRSPGFHGTRKLYKVGTVNEGFTKLMNDLLAATR
jgi:hypothetical protein